MVFKYRAARTGGTRKRDSQYVDTALLRKLDHRLGQLNMTEVAYDDRSRSHYANGFSSALGP